MASSTLENGYCSYNEHSSQSASPGCMQKFRLYETGSVIIFSLWFSFALISRLGNNVYRIFT
ncbi:hypothetical protein SLEP1_g59448 [Rubroshorea leprosula]|uniref:Uncharacterized protein n=1 Tax=Rubroshorea leprosula TaxID=152421 RepID=A0AAV5MTM9_9ROSI|nr:hypothetical protein SLEP1_g59448 [Rubroshorea leprosula]